MGYTKGDAPAAAEMARKDANQTGKGIKLKERSSILTSCLLGIVYEKKYVTRKSKKKKESMKC